MPTTTDSPARPAGVAPRSGLLRRCLWRLQALALIGLYWWPAKALSPAHASRWLGWLAAVVGPLLPRHRVVQRNLQLAFPKKSASERRALARAVWENIGRTAGELPHLPSLFAHGDERIVLLGAEHLEAVKSSGRGAVFVSGHFANWEVMPLVICQRLTDCLTVYRAANNPHIEQRLVRFRHSYGVHHRVAKGRAAPRALMYALAAGRPVALLNDQKFNEGLAVRFFGQQAMTSPGPAHLALKYAVPVIPVSVCRRAPMRFVVEFHTPFVPANTGDRAQDIQRCTEWINAFLEQTIRANPAQWLWLHRRWPEKYR